MGTAAADSEPGDVQPAHPNGRITAPPPPHRLRPSAATAYRRAVGQHSQCRCATGGRNAGISAVLFQARLGRLSRPHIAPGRLHPHFGQMRPQHADVVSRMPGSSQGCSRPHSKGSYSTVLIQIASSVSMKGRSSFAWTALLSRLGGFCNV